MRTHKKPAASRPFNTRDGAKIGRSFHQQVEEAMAKHPGSDDTLFAMCFAPLIHGMSSDKARLFMQCALRAECEAIRSKAMPQVAA